jgi:hypothetical protein
LRAKRRRTLRGRVSRSRIWSREGLLPARHLEVFKLCADWHRASRVPGPDADLRARRTCRKISHHPTAEWLARQITEAFPWASGCRLIRPACGRNICYPAIGRRAERPPSGAIIYPVVVALDGQSDPGRRVRVPRSGEPVLAQKLIWRDWGKDGVLPRPSYAARRS